jgi:predicted ferric reductase
MKAEISEANFDSDQGSTSKPNPKSNSNGSTMRKSKPKKISSKLTVAGNQEGDFKATPCSDARRESSKPSIFLPYENVSKCSPFFHIALQPWLPILKPISRRAHAIRWQLSRPLTTRLLPRWFPVGIFFDVSFLTYGQVLLALPLLGFFLAGYYQTFVSPDVDGSGKIAGLALVMVFLTANKSNSIFSFFLGISFERLIIYHNLSSLVAVTLSLFHGYVPYAFGNADDSGDEDRRRLDGDSQFELNGADPNVLKFMFDGTANISGSLLLLSMIVLVLSSFFPIFRRKFFDLWFWIHILSAISVVIFAIMHGIGTSVIFISWWVLDAMMRYMIMASCRYPKMAQLDLVTSDVVKISFIKPSNFSYNAGQFVQVAFPDLSLYAFHPISISSTSHEKVVTLYVRGLGNWSKKLVALAETKDSARILIEGPYGCVSLDIDDHERYQMALCVGGGIGVTHCQSVAKSILNEHNRGRKLKQLRFVWAVRDLEMLKVMEPLETSSDLLDIVLADSESGSEINKLVKTDIFLTKASQDSPTTLEDGRQVHDGRPDLNTIIKEMKEEAEILGVTHVAVFGCGPAKLLYQLKVACRANSSTLTGSKGVHFHVHEEVFEF